MKVEFSGHIFEKYSDFIKVRPVGAELFHADGRAHGQTDLTKLIIPFRGFAKAHEYTGTYFKPESKYNSMHFRMVQEF